MNYHETVQIRNRFIHAVENAEYIHDALLDNPPVNAEVIDTVIELKAYLESRLNDMEILLMNEDLKNGV